MGRNESDWSIFSGWFTRMGTDGDTFAPKSGYFLLVWVEVCHKKLAVSYLLRQF